MSRLEELIQKYCPDGVEYLSIGSLITRVRNKGGKNPSVKTVYSVSNTQGLVKAEDYRENVIYSEDTSNYIVVEKGMFAYNPARLNIGSLAWLQADQPGLVSPMYVVFSIDQTKITPEFLYLYLKSPYVNGKINSLTESGARFRFDFERWGLIEIPVPPLPVQEEIVKVLETFTVLQAELQVELQKRLQQSNFYRDNLLSFGGRTDIKRKRLGDICSVITKGTTPPMFQECGVSFVKTECFEGIFINKDKLSFVSEEIHNNFLKRSILNENDILITIAGATIGKSVLVPKDILPANTNQALAIIRVNKENNPQFVFHVLRSGIMSQYIKKSIKGSAQPNLTLALLNDFLVPIPSSQEQEKIISILNRFDTLTYDLTAGLPAEIEKRRQQYEFYRDKLLTFKRKEA